MAKIKGTSSSNHVRGQGSKDIIYGYGGSDRLYGQGGNDSIVGGTGSDKVYGSKGNDSISGNSGKDRLYGQSGNDHLMGGSNNDRIMGSSGRDRLFGQSGNDTLNSGSGSDQIDGGSGNDAIYGSSGDDLFTEYAGSGNDTIDGGSGIDTVFYNNHGDSTPIIFNMALNTFGTETEFDQLTKVEVVQVVNSLNDTITAGDLTTAVTINLLTSELAGGVTDGVVTAVGFDNAIGGGGNDSITGNILANSLSGGDGNDTIDGGEQNDTLDGGNGDDFLSGNEDNDLLSGGSDNDTLDGGIGSDTLNGGTGNDSLAGGADDDTYNGFTSGFGHDIISDSAGSADNLDLTDYLVGDVVFSAKDTDSNGSIDALQLDFSSGDQIRILNYFANTAALASASSMGSGAIEQILFKNGVTWAFSDVKAQLVLSEALTLTGGAGDDSLIGLTGNDSIDGAGGNDTLTGGSGNDTLIGGTGIDSLVGGAGDDAYYVDSASDVVVENPNEGNDTIYSSVSYTMPANVENLILTGSANISGTGNADANAITGNSGNNTLNGGGGNDTLTGGSGDDTYIINNLGVVITEQSGGGTDTVISSMNYTLDSQVENLTLSGSSNLSATGNTLNNVITGNSGNNTLDGLGGNDTLIGGTGNDTYVIDSIGDVIQENTGEGTDLVRTSISYTLGANLENLTLLESGAINGTGNELNNVITGNTGDNTLDGMNGNDTLIAGAGNDNLTGGEGNDVMFGGTGEDTVTGGSGNDSLNGGLGQDVLTGGSGDDTLEGAGGNDMLVGEDGNDTYAYSSTGFGSDSILDLSGSNDWIDFRNFTEGATINLNSSEIFNDGHGNMITTINSNALENAYGSGSNDVITGSNTVGNQLHGGAGNDSINGLGGNDTLSGGLGNDTLVGGSGDDTYLFASTTLPEYNWFAADTGTDVIDDASNSSGDVLYLYGWNLSDVESWQAIDSNDAGSQVDTLVITLNSGETLSILNYFDNSSVDDDLSHAGTGCIESIIFNAGAGDTVIDFTTVLSLVP